MKALISNALIFKLKHSLIPQLLDGEKYQECRLRSDRLKPVNSILSFHQYLYLSNVIPKRDLTYVKISLSEQCHVLIYANIFV